MKTPLQLLLPAVLLAQPAVCTAFGVQNKPDDRPLLRIEGKLTPERSHSGKFYQTHTLKLPEVATYRIDLRSHEFDCYLILKDSAGKVLEQDDDGGADGHRLLHSRIHFRPVKAGAYVLHVTSFDEGKTGRYELTVRKTDERVLLGADARRVRELEANLPFASNLADAEKTAKEIIAIRTRVQGARHWKAIDARLMLDDLTQLVRLTAPEQQLFIQAGAFNRQAVQLRRAGKLGEGLAHAKKALDLRMKLFGEKHPATAQSYASVGSFLHDLGKYAEALPFRKKALDIRKNLLGEDHPDIAAACNNVATSLIAQGKYALAMTVLHKALGIQKKLLGEQHLHTATSYNNLAACLHGKGEFAGALQMFQKALEIHLTLLPERHPSTSRGYNNVAACLIKLGKYAEALALAQKGLDIRIKLLGEFHPATALSFNNAALCLDVQGKHAEALHLYQKALDIRLKVLGKEHPHTADSYNNIAMCQFDQRKYTDALQFSRNALDIRLQTLPKNHPDIAQSYHNVAICLYRQGKYADAFRLNKKGLDIRREALGEHHRDTGASYHFAAMTLNEQGKHATALPLFHKGLSINAKVFGEQHSDTAACSSCVALCLYYQGKHAEAASYWAKALFGHEFGRLQAAKAGFDRAMFRESLLSPRAALAGCMFGLKKPVQAWEHAESDMARGLLDDLEPDTDHANADVGKLARLQYLDTALFPFLTREKLNSDEINQRDALAKERDALLAQMARTAAKRVRDRVLSLERIQKKIPADTALVFWLDVLDQNLGCVLRREGPPAWVTLRGSGKDDDWTDDDWSLPSRTLAVLAASAGDRTTRERLVLQLHRQRIAPLERHLKGVTNLLIVPAGQMSAVPVEALTDRYTISYVPSASIFAHLMEKHRPLDGSSLLVLADPVFTRTAPKYPPAPPHGLLIKAVLPKSLAARIRLRPGDVLLEYNGRELTEPDDLKVAKGKDRIAIKLWREGKTLAGRIPAGKLGVAVDRRPIAKALADWRKDKHELVALVRGSKEWQPLTGTRLEARTLAALVRGTTVLLGSNASEQQLDALAAAGKLKQFRLLHLATHGEANPKMARETALILAQDRLPLAEQETKLVLASLHPNSKSAAVPRGRLTVGKILSSWNLDADLVVLSACQTGLGRQAAGEGMLGFTQALMQKGARSVVLSRWKVDDAATALLMQRFYKNLLGRRDGLKSGMYRAEALKEAKLWLRNLPRKEAQQHLATLVNGVPRSERGTIKAALPTRRPDAAKDDRPFAHSYYWAAFVLIGDPK